MPSVSTTTSQRRIATMGYRDCLVQNGVEFVYDLDANSSIWFDQRTQDPWEALILQQKEPVILHNKYREIAKSKTLHFSSDGAQDDALIFHAIKLFHKVKTMAIARESGEWRRFIDIELFHHYGYFDTFSSSQGIQWAYDPWTEASARQQLVCPKPDFAFGVKIKALHGLHDILRQLPELTYPHVSPSCEPTDPWLIAFPFLILESKSTQGDANTCNNQLAHSVIKALDSIASLDLQHKLFVIGICQIGFAYEIYLAYIPDEVSRADVPDEDSLADVLDEDSPADVPRQYTIELLTTGDLRALGDMIRLLRVLDAARHYGRRTFTKCIVAKLQELKQKVSEGSP